MSETVLLNAHKAVSDLAEKVADTCRRRLLERPGQPVPFEHIVYQTSADPQRVRTAVAWLKREGRLDLGLYALRSRPHVVVEAVERIDDLSVARRAWGPGSGTS